MSENNKKPSKFTNEDFKTMQSWDLDRKISVSLARIAEFYSKFPNKIYVSFSDGKDSTVLLHLVRRLYPDSTLQLFLKKRITYRITLVYNEFAKIHYKGK